MMRVLKIGGNELNAPGFLDKLADEIAAIAVSQPVIVVHGGGQDIAALQERLGLPERKVDGLRVTDSESLKVAEMALSGRANKLIVRALLAAGLDAFGVSGVDGGLLRCRQKTHPSADLGLVGEIISVRSDLVEHFLAAGLTPVISPISLGPEGQAYNVNADEAAGAIAAALPATLLDFVSNVPGVVRGGAVIPHLTVAEAEALIAQGVIGGGMIPKVRMALEAVGRGVPRARIVNLDGLNGDGGTLFTSETD